VGFFNGSIQVWGVNDAISIEEENGMSIPDWATPELRAEIVRLKNLFHSWENGWGLPLSHFFCHHLHLHTRIYVQKYIYQRSKNIRKAKEQ
jgi:hypothetical protein